MSGERGAAIDRERYDTVILDLDGVVTSTARIHAAGLSGTVETTPANLEDVFVAATAKPEASRHESP